MFTAPALSDIVTSNTHKLTEISHDFLPISHFFPSSGSEYHIFLHFGGWQVCKRPINALRSVYFCTSMAHLVKGTV